VTVPFPVPVWPVTSVIQLGVPVVVHVHPADVVTPIGVPVPPAAPIVAVVGATVNEQDIPASVMVICCPAIVSVAVRRELVGFAAAEMFTVPLPVPLAPDVMVIQLALPAVAVHEQLLVVVTVNELRLLPDEGNESVVGFTAYEQVDGAGADAAACVTVTTRPAMVSVPVRAAPVFAAALNVTESGPKL
jgi:hypothetical protein